MENSLNEYLENIEKYLKPLPISERVDIVKEIKSEILELQNDGKTADEIVERLGNPKELAKAYLGDLIAKDNSFNHNRILAMCAFYSLVGFSGMFVIPCLAIMAPVFVVFGIITPILGVIKMINYIFDLGLPYVEHIGIILTVVELNPIVEFFGYLITGVLLYCAGRGCWKLLVRYIKTVSNTGKQLSL